MKTKEYYLKQLMILCGNRPKQVDKILEENPTEVKQVADFLVEIQQDAYQQGLIDASEKSLIKQQTKQTIIMPSTKNPLCMGNKCVNTSGEVRLLPISSEVIPDLILCVACYEEEMKYRRRVNSFVSQNLLEIPKWEDLKVCEEAKPDKA